MTLLDEIEATDNISLSDPERLRTLLAKLCTYSMALEARIVKLESDLQQHYINHASSPPYFIHGGV